VTKTARFTLPLDASEWTSGNYYIIVAVDADSAVYETSETNNLFVSGKIALSYPPLSDLQVSSVTAPSTAAAGGLVELVWDEVNAGARTVAEVRRDAIYISTDGTLENATLLKTVRRTDTLSAGESVRRRETVTVPSTGYYGSVRFIVVSDFENAVPEGNETNNSGVSSAPTALAQSLGLSFSASEVNEGTANVRGTVTRTGSLLQPLTVSIASSDTTELTVSESVTIPAGQASASFYYSAVKDDEYDADAFVELTFTAPGFAAKYGTVKVVNVDHPKLTLTLSKSTLAEGEEFTVTVTRSYVTDRPVTVYLTPSKTSQLTLPTSVVIPANEASAAVTAAAVDDDVPENEEEITITATSPTFTSAGKTVSVVDDDEPTIAIALDSETVLEGVGGSAFVGTVSRAEAAQSDLRVRLTSSNPAKIGVPNEVTIPAGKKSVTFYGASYDNGAVDGSVAVTITATGVLENCNCSMSSDSTGTASTSITVLDDDGPALTLSFNKAMLTAENPNAATLTVTRNTGTEGDLTVTFSTSDAVLTAPATAVIPAGSASATVTIATGVLSSADGVWATVGASADGYTPGSAKALVSAAQKPDLRPANVDAVQKEGDLGTYVVSYYVVNDGAVPVQGTWTEKVWASPTATLDSNAVLMATFTRSETISNAEGANFVTRSFETAPIDFIDAAYWIVSVDADDAINELVETNNVAVSGELTFVPPYAAVVQTDVEKADPSEPIPLYGYAYDVNTGARVGGVDVAIEISNGSVKRTVTATAAADGSFTATWTPLPTEVGSYTVGAKRPGGADAPVQDTFSLMRLTASTTRAAVRIVEGETVAGSFEVYNKTSEPITGLGTRVEGLPANIQLDVVTSSTVIPPGGSATVTVVATALDASVPASQAKIFITSAETQDLETTFGFNVYQGAALLTTDTPILSTSMKVGAQKIVEFEICNESGSPTGPIAVDLPELEWLSCVNGAELPSLEPGEARKVQLLLNPAADLEQTMYQGSLVLKYKNSGLKVDFKFRAQTDNYADLTVRAVDEWFYYSEDAPAIEGANVKVVDSLTKQVVSTGVTGSEGTWTVVGLQEGYYDIYVDAEGHNNYSETVYFDEGRTVNAMLQLQTVRYEWTVTPTTIEDEYDITIETVFEANVPAPVITVTPNTVDLKSMQVGDRMQVDFVVENHGLIAVYDATPYIAPVDGYIVTPLVEKLDVLPAKSSYVIPTIIERVDPAAVSSAPEFEEEAPTAPAAAARPGFVMNSIEFESADSHAVQWNGGSGAAINDGVLASTASSGSCVFSGVIRGWYICEGDRPVDTPFYFTTPCAGGGGSSSYSGSAYWGGGWWWGNLEGAASSTTHVAVTGSACEPCVNKLWNIVLDCKIGDIPKAGRAYGCGSSIMNPASDAIGQIIDAGDCLTGHPIFCVLKLVKEAYDCFDWDQRPIFPDDQQEFGLDSAPLYTTADGSRAYLKTVIDSMYETATQIQTAYKWVEDFYGDSDLFKADWDAGFELFKTLTSKVGSDRKID
ncbi:MAG: PEGA domain-containing protein, partial [Thermoguttaceae bacterium]|nr:PEGA domain-containing protein [Thermoguttaceae bacterium]